MPRRFKASRGKTENGMFVIFSPDMVRVGCAASRKLARMQADIFNMRKKGETDEALIIEIKAKPFWQRWEGYKKRGSPNESRIEGFA